MQHKLSMTFIGNLEILACDWLAPLKSPYPFNRFPKIPSFVLSSVYFSIEDRGQIIMTAIICTKNDVSVLYFGQHKCCTIYENGVMTHKHDWTMNGHEKCPTKWSALNFAQQLVIQATNLC